MGDFFFSQGFSGGISVEKKLKKTHCVNFFVAYCTRSDSTYSHSSTTTSDTSDSLFSMPPSNFFCLEKSNLSYCEILKNIEGKANYIFHRC